MTRARRSRYLIIRHPGASTSNNFPRLLTATLGERTGAVSVGRLALPGSFSTGESGWHLEMNPARQPPAGAAAIERIGTGVPWRSVRLSARRPSDARVGRFPGTALFPIAAGRAADFGAAVHGLLASVEWWSPGDAVAWAGARRQAGADEAVLSEVLGCLGDPALARVFARPAGIAEVWRERAFEGVIDGMWITGVFDRVVIARDAAGGAQTRVTVVDFKSDRVEDPEQMREAAERHAGQLDLYRKVAAVLAGVESARIECQIVFTGCRRMVTVPPRT